MIISEGDRIAADAEIIQCLNLTVDESIITGESIHVEKDTTKNSLLYSGTLATAGSALAITKRTGINTEMDKIAKVLTPLRSLLPGFRKKLSCLSNKFQLPEFS
jgi:Ca2+-transporting ATPase